MANSSIQQTVMANMMDVGDETWETLLWWPETQDTPFIDGMSNSNADPGPSLSIFQSPLIGPVDQ